MSVIMDRVHNPLQTCKKKKKTFAKIAATKKVLPGKISPRRLPLNTPVVSNIYMHATHRCD